MVTQSKLKRDDQDDGGQRWHGLAWGLPGVEKIKARARYSEHRSQSTGRTYQVTVFCNFQIISSRDASLCLNPVIMATTYLRWVGSGEGGVCWNYEEGRIAF